MTEWFPLGGEGQSRQDRKEASLLEGTELSKDSQRREATRRSTQDSSHWPLSKGLHRWPHSIYTKTLHLHKECEHSHFTQRGGEKTESGRVQGLLCTRNLGSLKITWSSLWGVASPFPIWRNWGPERTDIHREGTDVGFKPKAVWFHI